MSSPAPQFKGIISLAFSLLYCPALPYMTTGKTIALTIRTFVGKVMPLLFNMLSRFVTAFLMVQLSHQYMTIGKTVSLTIWTFVSKVMPLLFNMLSRFVIAFLPRTKNLLQ